MSKKENLSQSLLKELIYYNPDTGLFTWKLRDRRFFETDRSFNSWNHTYPGTKAGKRSINEYEKIMILGKRYASHRLAFLYVFGYMPDLVDHINGDIVDNRIKNLREATHSQNGHNKKKPINNSSGFKGISWSKQQKKWEAHITINRKRIRIGFFKDKQEAVSTIIAERQKMVGDFANNK